MNKVTTIIFLLFSLQTFAQINPENITIARDEWGLPHIFAPTDREVAYGLAWVQCEDQFTIIQQTYLFTKKRLGRAYGKAGAGGDFFAALFQMDQLVDERLATDVSPEFLAYIQAYCDAINAYAAAHPKKVIDEQIFPITPTDVLASYPLKILDFIGVSDIVSGIVNGDRYDQQLPSIDADVKGSNSFAFKRKMTKDGKTYLIANPHLSFTGPSSFYEVQVMSEEGWNFQGALFPGSLSPQIGTNKNLGWTHTNNYYDHSDVYALKMHPTEKLKYEYDGEWKTLESRKIKLKVKLKPLPFPITVSKTVYESEYGPTLKSKAGNYFAIRSPASMTIKIAEQWYEMGKAQNLKEFQTALAINGLPYFNITYADKEDNIFYLCNGLFADRAEGYDWTKVLPGNTSKTKWESFVPLEERPLIMNPDCGYVYNVNHNPFKCTCEESWLDKQNYSAEVDYDQLDDNMRSYQWREIYEDRTPVSMEELKAFKYDARIPKSSSTYKILEGFRAAKVSSELQPMVDALKKWNTTVASDKVAPTYFLLSWFNIPRKYWQMEEMPPEAYVAGLTAAKDHLMKHFGTLNVPFRDFFRFKRGDKNIHLYGFPNTLAARSGRISEKDGRYYASGGDGFMMFIEYGKDGVERMESIVAYGGSSDENSTYYNNQMELFATKEAKPQSFDKEEIMSRAVKVYHPKK